MERTILHVDCNKFYASVESLYRPEVRDKPMAVGGSTQSRHGIILTKNELASKYGLTVGEPLWQARQKCPELIIVPPNYPLYLRFSRLCRKVYEDYTDRIEPFGLDECWLDITGCGRDGEEVANEIRERIKYELGITVSVGVSFNKIFAKLGSDYKKPDAVTVIGRDNYKSVAWPLACKELLFVGRSTTRKLNYYGIETIGDIARCDVAFLKKILGKNGETLWRFANGLDSAEVRHMDEIDDVKSVGNSTTTVRDLVDEDDVKTVMRVLCESVARRLREQGLRGRVITISVRDNALNSFTRQCRMRGSTDISSELLTYAMSLFREHYEWDSPIRSLGVSVSDFDTDFCEQFDFYSTVENREKQEKLENTLDTLRRRFGSYCVQRAFQLERPELSGFNPHDEHIIHPIAYRAG